MGEVVFVIFTPPHPPGGSLNPLGPIGGRGCRFSNAKEHPQSAQ